MFSAFASIISLLASWGLLLVANSLLTTLLALRAEAAPDAFTTTTVGLITAGYFLGLFIGARYGDRLVIHVGHIRAYAVYASFTSVAALIHAIAVDPYVWMAVRFGAGFCMAALVMITESWLNSRATNTTRGQILSLYMTTNYLAAGLGQLLIPLADPNTFRLFAIASIAYSIALVPVLLTRLIAPQVSARERVEVTAIYRISPVAMIGSLISGLCGSALFGLGPLFTLGHGISTNATAMFMALVIFGGVLLQWPIGKLSDRMDRRKIILAVSALSAIAALGIVGATGLSSWVLFAAAVLFGSLAFTVYPIAAAHMNDSTPSDKMMQTSAGLLTAYGAGAVIGPILASNLMQWIGPSALFYFIAAAFGAYALIALKRMRVTPAPKRRKRRMWFTRTELSRHRRRKQDNPQKETDGEPAKSISDESGS